MTTMHGGRTLVKIFFTDSFSHHKKVRQVAICLILTSYNFNCFKNIAFDSINDCMKKKVAFI
jgi:hypothetical protein